MWRSQLKTSIIKGASGSSITFQVTVTTAKVTSSENLWKKPIQHTFTVQNPLIPL